MSELTVSRTLVKSPPELWSECSDAAALARHLDERLGEIRITGVEPESAVAWEGEEVSGTVRLEPAGWGTKVILTANVDGAAVSEPEPAAPAEEAPQPERFLGRLLSRWRQRATDEAVAQEPSEPSRALEVEQLLTAALESLGQAHHRPFSRA